MQTGALFNAIIRQAVEDIYNKEADVRQEAIDWFMDDMEGRKTDDNLVTFIDCCDFTGRTPYPIRKLMPFMITGRITKTRALEHFNVESTNS